LALVTELVDKGAQPERTALSWLRTAASTTFASLFLFRYLIEAGHQAMAFILGGCAILIAPTLLLIGLRRASVASRNWNESVQNNKEIIFISLAVGLLAILTSITVLLV
jgi:high-affinity Fe2+/Pb2+ permease